MFSKEKMEILNLQFQRIFALPMSRLTYRELQNAIVTAADGDLQKVNQVIDSLFKGGAEDLALKEFVEHYKVNFRVARQVQDSGDVLSLLTTDIGTQGEKFLFSVRIRRIDGGEFNFITDTEGMIQTAEHIVGQFEELKKSTMGKGTLADSKGRLEHLKARLERLFSA